MGDPAGTSGQHDGPELWVEGAEQPMIPHNQKRKGGDENEGETSDGRSGIDDGPEDKRPENHDPKCPGGDWPEGPRTGQGQRDQEGKGVTEV